MLTIKPLIMRNRRFIEPVFTPTPAHLELGLNTTALIMKDHLAASIPDAYQLMAERVTEDGNEGAIADLEIVIGNVKKDAYLVCIGYEIGYLENMIPKFNGIIAIPNAGNVDVKRLEDNYSSILGFKALNPVLVADMICPDSVVLVPVYPLDDGTTLTYNYPSKILSSELRRIGFQIIGIEQSFPLSIRYGYDNTGLTRVLNRIDPSIFTHYITYKNE
jgi:hypothetical protein